MSTLPTSRPRSRSSRPRLKVVGGEPRPSHVAGVTLHGRYSGRPIDGVRIEVITQTEWDALSEPERPEDAYILPGIGFFLFEMVEPEESQRLADEAVEWYGQYLRSRRGS